MYHSIQIIPDAYGVYKEENSQTHKLTGKYEGKNTWDDWHLIPSTRPLFDPPAPKTNYIDVPGLDGSIDLSTALTNGYPVFQDRTGSQEFYVMNGYKEWYQAYSDIMNYCHGQKCKVILEDEPYYYYLGRVTVNKWKSEKDWSKIVLDFSLEPYKYELFDSEHSWLWDPFSFIDGVVMQRSMFTDFVIAESNTKTTKIIPVRTFPCCPTFKVTPLTTPGPDCKLKITLNKHWTDHDDYIIHKEEVFTEADPAPFTYHDIVLRDFVTHDAHHLSSSVPMPSVSLVFETEVGVSFKVSVGFRRGKL